MQSKYFIRLSNMILNKSHIVCIEKQPTKYFITMNLYHLQGGILFGSGNISSELAKIEVCKEKSPNDYEIINRSFDDL
jgi:hypothetical protein